MFQTVRGMRDFLPEKMIKKQLIEDLCREVFEKYGFKPLQTPAVEDFKLLAGKSGAGEAIKKEIYYFKDQSERELGLRFDLTVPMARVVASNKDLPKPFKRYVIGQVWRYDRPQAKRYREFTQADVDIVGVKSVKADFETIAAVIEIFERLGFEFIVRMNNRKLLEEIILKCGVEKEKIVETLRSLDKADKISWEEIGKELQEKEINPEIIEVMKNNDLNSVPEIKETEGYKELMELVDLLEKAGLGKYVKIDLTLARGLEYYTGCVYELVSNASVSLCGGGRYDKMIGALGGTDTPAAGWSIGVDRVLDLMEEKIKPENKTKVYIIPVGPVFSESLKLTQEIRKLGLGAEIDLMERNVSKNFDYANKQKIPFVAVLGEKELKENCFTLKEMSSGKETKIKLSEVEALKELI